MIKNRRVTKYIPRKLEGKIQRFMDSPEILAILGARQVGKTTLMQHVYEGLPGNKVFLDFEDQEMRLLFDEDAEAFAQLYVKNNDFVFIDEFQYSTKGGEILKFLFDRYKTKFVISGSSSMDITLRAISALVGRVFIMELYPLSFDEFLNHRDPEMFSILKDKSERMKTLHVSLHERLLTYLEEFTIWGGYPRVVLSKSEEEKQEVLKNIFTTYLLKDIRGFFRLSTESSIQKLVRMLALQVGNLIQYNDLSAGAQLSYPALKKHLAILEETYIIKLLKPFYTNKRVEITKNPKVYFIDPGMRNYVCRDFRQWKLRNDLGALVENYVCNELCKMGLEINFWRTKSKAEVDFIIAGPLAPIPVEVKASTSTRAGKSLISFLKKYKQDNGYVLYEGQSATRTYSGFAINFVPLYAVNFLGLGN